VLKKPVGLLKDKAKFVRLTVKQKNEMNNEMTKGWADNHHQVIVEL
jgi:hypothetical protein